MNINDQINPHIDGINFDALSQENKERLISDSISFLRSITEVCGEELGVKMWERLAEAFGPDLKGSVFFAMITGDDNSSVRFTHPAGRPIDRIGIIKAIRSATGLSLQEAKHLSDLAYDIEVVIPDVLRGQRHVLVQELRRFGAIAR